MDILQRGNIDIIYKRKKFLCTYCECVFKANEEEYYESFPPSEGRIEYIASCPDCEQQVIRIECYNQMKGEE